MTDTNNNKFKASELKHFKSLTQDMTNDLESSYKQYNEYDNAITGQYFATALKYIFDNYASRKIRNQKFDNFIKLFTKAQSKKYNLQGSIQVGINYFYHLYPQYK
jgi:hypothetical protein